MFLTKTQTIAALVSLLFTIPAYAYSVKGSLIDATTGEALPSATYHIYSANDTVRPIINNITDADGAFSSTLPKQGTYRLKAEFLGLAPAIREFSVDKQHPDFDLGTISMAQDGELLQEVVITGRKPLVQSDGATLTYNISEDPERDSNSILEMLKKVPMVTVDGQDNIRVKGSSNFKIYVNGKADPAYEGEKGINALKATPAATIEKIEVITDPGAKFDAEGTGGILNLVTRRGSKLEGYSANITAMSSDTRFGFNAYGMTKVKNVTASASAHYGKAFSTKWMYADMQQEFLNLDDDHQLNQALKVNNYNSNMFYNLDLSWEPDTLNLFTLNAGYGNVRINQNLFSENTRFNRGGEMTGRYFRDGHIKAKYGWANVASSFQHTFFRPGHHIIFSYQFDYNLNPSTLDYMDKADFGYTFDNPFSRQQESNYEQMHTAQIDYANPFSEKHLFETGAKGVFRRNRSDSRQLIGQDADATLTKMQNIRMMQYNDVMALYTSYTGSYGKWSPRVGVRYEHTYMGIDFRTGDYTNFRTRLNDVVPNASLTYKITELQNLRASYAMRISRPSLDEVNPYRQAIFANQVSMGNPDLESEHSNQVSLSYSNFGGIVGMQFTTEYTNISNSILQHTYTEKDVAYTTYGNLGLNEAVNFTSYTSFRLSHRFNADVYLQGTYRHFKADQLNLSRAGWQGFFSANFTYRAPFKTVITGSGGYSTKNVELQGRGQGWYYYGLSVSQSFLKEDRLKLTLSAYNFLQGTQTMSASTTTADYINRSSFSMHPWGISLSATIRLGKLTTSVKKTDADLGINDSSSAGGSNASQGVGGGSPGVGQ